MLKKIRRFAAKIATRTSPRGVVGAAGQGNLPDERWGGTRVVPSTPTRGLPIHDIVTWAKIRQMGVFPLLHHQFSKFRKKKAAIAPQKSRLPCAWHHVSQFSEKVIFEFAQTKSLLTQASVTKGRRTHHLARPHTGSKCACGATKTL